MDKQNNPKENKNENIPKMSDVPDHAGNTEKDVFKGASKFVDKYYSPQYMDVYFY